MKLTKKLEAEVLAHYKTYWDAYLKGDLKTFASYLDENIVVYGTAVGEIFTNKKDAVKFYTETADQMTGKAEFRNRTFNLKAKGETIVIFEQSDLYVLMDGVWTFYDSARITGILEKKGNNWKLVHQHGSFPDSRTDEGDQISTDKIKAENLRLKKAIKRRTLELENKNRELEIETALEKVRAVAMGMNKPEDMLEVCRIISDQLHILGLNDIRNIQTAIIDEEKSFYLNYQYFTAYDRSAIELAEYNKHPKAREMAETMKRSANEFFSQSFDGEELNVFRQYRKQDNQFPDPILEKSNSLHFYFYSIGPGALGISTYNSTLSESDMGLFKRFRNVFELAYRRFIDIELAIAQAREAKIEAALEKVRAVAMSMNKPDDLLNVCEILFTEFHKLGFDEMRNAMINIHNDEKETFINYDYSDEIGRSINHLTYNIHPVIEKQIKQIRSTNDAFSETSFTGKDLEEWKKFRNKIGEKDDPRINNLSALYYYFYSIGTGSIGISTFSPIGEEKLVLLKRFRNVFSLSYQRYSDITLAETQAREAQIELALERVRARTMAMQHSEELQETSYVLFDQLRNLGETAEQLSIGIFNENRGVIELSVTLAGSKLPNTYEVPFDEPFIMGKAYQAWKAKKRSFVYELSGKALKDYNQYRNKVFGGKLSSKEKTYTKRIVYFAFFSKGVISFSSHEERPYETVLLFERFAAVFDLTYTRFNDLKKAEEQAREAKIEVALERIRARATAMHTSDELMDVATILREQMGLLGQPELETCVVDLFDENSDQVLSWYAFRQPELASGKFVTGASSFSWQSSELTREMMMIYRSGQKECTLEVEGAKTNEFFQVLVKASPEIEQYVGESIPDKMCYHITFFSGGALLMVSYQLPSDEAKALQRRAAFVFDMAYRRYCDLKKAEAQAREAKIEAALERVRSRSIAMHKSDELLEAGEILFLEMQKLGIESLTAGYVLMDKEEKNGLNYAPNPLTKKILPSPVIIPHNETVHLQQVVKNWKKGNSFFIVEMNEAETIKHQTFIAERSINFPLNAAQLIAISPAKLFLHNFYFKEGYLLIVGGLKLSAEQTDIMLRFTKVFQQTYTRFLDLQKAEAQAMEAQIEAALERVRSRTMGMQKSEELKDVIRVVYEQFVHLKIHVDHAGFVVDYTPKGDWHFWIADEQEIPSKITHPYFESVWANQFNEAKEKDADFFATNLNFEEKNKFYNELLSYVPGLPEASKDFYLKCPGLAASTVLLENVSLYIENFSGIPYSDEENATLMRFGKVFQQTYTRFLDLQKAEAQAREAQIEAALERTRTQSMIMQHSNELDDTLRVFHEQVLLLGIHSAFSFLWLPDEEKDRHIFWAAWTENNSTDFSSKAINYPLDRNEPATAQCLIDWKGNEPVVSYHVPPAGVEDYFAAWQELIAGVEKLRPKYFSDGLHYVEAFLKYGCFGVMVKTDLTEDEKKLLSRFAIEFERTYTRFLDLQKAEAQAREAEIELSLERVRSKAMAMHSPNDLSETVNVFFKELKTLGIIPIRCGVGQIDEATRTTSLTTTTSSQQGDSFQVIGKVKQTGHPVLDGIFDHWKLQKEYHPVLKGEEIKDYYDVMNAQIGYPEYPEGVTQYGNNFFFKEGFVFAWTENLLSEEELIIFRRFTSVLSLTYRRYMDLKEAEAQAREAQIEASLERVRSRTMGMQKSDELAETASVLFKQLLYLGIKSTQLRTCGIVTFKENEPKGEVWITDITGEIIDKAFIAPYDEAPAYKMIYSKWKKGEKFLEINLKGDDFLEHLNFVKKYSAVPNINLDEIKKLYTEIFFHVLFFSQGYLFIISYEPLPEYHDIFKRFGALFQQTYTRFLDFKKVEAQARESQIEAALERVRSKAMAMHSSEDLAITVDTFFSELNGLKVTPHRCGMGIIDEQSKIVAIHATTVTHENEIKKMTGNLKLSGHPVLDSIFDNWRLQKEYHPVLRGNEIIEYYEVMNPQVSFPDFAGDETQYGYYFFFKEGGVFAWTDKELADGDLQIFRRYTSVLSLTYRRYKDLKEAEAQAREAKIEAAMEKVRARAMAMKEPGQLVEVAQLLRKEMSLLGVEELETSSIYVHDSASGLTECWYAIQDIREQDKKLVTDHMTLSLNDTWVGREMMKFYASNQKQTSILMQGENRKEWINYCADHSKVLQGYYGEIIPERTYHLLKFSNGFMGAASPGDLSEESWALLNRATNVFSLAYTRFLDLQKAEAQTREAQIELALERVRARTMAMHKSDELAETAAIVFQQLNNLGIEPNRIYITIIKDETGTCEFWITDEDGSKVSSAFRTNLNENFSFNKMFNGWKERKKSITIDMLGEELQEYFKHLSSLNVPFKGGLSQKRRLQYIAYFSKGFIGLASPDETKPETIQLLERFAAVFNLTYTRFNDLLQAEAQNKIIQAENERKTKELEDARQLQLSMLPKELPRLPHLDIAVYMKLATEVGGDYYDFNICNDGTLTILVCDATGHGMMSGMMVSIMKSIFISNRNNIDLKEFFENTNNSLKEMHLGRLMMASLGVQITSDKVIATNAGMPSLLYFRNKSKKAGEFVSNNLPLGAMKGIKYSLKEIKYGKGDTLLLMSDGFAELRNENNEQYGYNRVKEEFMSVAQKSSNEIVEHLKISATQWIKGVEPDDDVTFVVIKVK